VLVTCRSQIRGRVDIKHFQDEHEPLELNEELVIHLFLNELQSEKSRKLKNMHEKPQNDLKNSHTHRESLQNAHDFGHRPMKYLDRDGFQHVV